MQIRFLTMAIAVSTIMIASACAPQEPSPDPAPPVRPQPITPPIAAAPIVLAPQGKWTDWPITQGDWAYRQDARGSIALFGPTGQDALVTMRCDTSRRQIFISRKSNQSSANFTIRSSARLKNATAKATGGNPAYLALQLTPRDPILDAMAYTRGRIALQVTGETSLAIPVWSEIGRVIDDCR